jgi:hypothetical protein
MEMNVAVPDLAVVLGQLTTALDAPAARAQHNAAVSQVCGGVQDLVAMVSMLLA